VPVLGEPEGLIAVRRVFTQVVMSACTKKVEVLSQSSRTTSVEARSATLMVTTSSMPSVFTAKRVSGLFLGQRNLPPGGAEMLFKN
jgi:hypothetical protein